jgi:DNA-binding NarL/FixJ family response regulator
MKNHTKKIRILVSETTPMGSSLLVGALEREPSFQLMKPVTPDELKDALQAERPDIVILSISTTDRPYGGCEIAREIRSVSPDARLILLLEDRKREAVLKAFQTGARAVFCRTESVQLLVKCIWAVNAGQIWANSSEIGYALEALIQLSAAQVTCAKVDELFTSRELQVLRCIAQGLSNREIADRLGLSEHTIKNYLFRMFDKAGVSNRVELLVCSLSQSCPETRQGEASVNDKPAVALDSCLTLAQRFATSQYIIRDACRGTFTDSSDRIAAAVWALVSERTCATIWHCANLAIENLISGLSESERAEAKRRAETWLRENATMNKYLPSESVLRNSKAVRSEPDHV